MFAVFPAPYVAAGGSVTSLAFHDDAYSSTDQITVPGTVQAGDLIILSDFSSDKVGAPSLVTPSGFTNWINVAGDFTRVAVSYKIATGSETTLTGMSEGFIDDKILAVFRPDVAITTITASTPTTQITDGNPSAQNIVATNGTLPLIAFGFYANNSGTINPRTMSPAATAELNGGAINYHYLKYQLQNASLVDVSIDMDDEGFGNTLAGGYLWAA
jgi:hypothetical protein